MDRQPESLKSAAQRQTTVTASKQLTAYLKSNCCLPFRGRSDLHVQGNKETTGTRCCHNMLKLECAI